MISNETNARPFIQQLARVGSWQPQPPWLFLQRIAQRHADGHIIGVSRLTQRLSGDHVALNAEPGGDGFDVPFELFPVGFDDPVFLEELADALPSGPGGISKLGIHTFRHEVAKRLDILQSDLQLDTQLVGLDEELADGGRYGGLAHHDGIGPCNRLHGDDDRTEETHKKETAVDRGRSPDHHKCVDCFRWNRGVQG